MGESIKHRAYAVSWEMLPSVSVVGGALEAEGRDQVCWGSVSPVTWPLGTVAWEWRHWPDTCPVLISGTVTSGTWL